MMVITKSKRDKDVGKALDPLILEINKELEKVDGLISNLECEVSVGPLDASVSIAVFVDGEEPRRKFLVGVNVKGYSKENSLEKAERRINEVLRDMRGRIAGSFVKTISSLPGRVYTTLIIASNDDVVVDANDAESRRKRIKRCIELLGNDPAVINVAKLSGVFKVSRTMIYKDLEVLGYKRVKDL